MASAQEEVMFPTGTSPHHPAAGARGQTRTQLSEAQGDRTWKESGVEESSRTGTFEMQFEGLWQ